MPVMQIPSEDLAEILSLTVPIGIKQPILPFSANVLVKTENGKASAASGNVEMTAIASCEANVQNNIDVLVAGETLLAAVRSLPKGAVIEATYSTENNRLGLKTDTVSFSFPTLSSENFLSVPVNASRSASHISGKEFGKTLDRIIYAAENQIHNFNTHGILFEPDGDAVKIVALDRIRMASTTLNIRLERSCIVSKSSLVKIRKLIREDDDLAISIDQDLFWIAGNGDYEFAVRQLSGDFPPYQQVIPKPEIVVPIDRTALYNAVSRCLAICKNQSKTAQIALNNNVISIKKDSQLESFYEEVSVDQTKQQFEFIINPEYLFDALSAVDDKVIDICYTPDKPVSLVAHSSNTLALIQRCSSL